MPKIPFVLEFGEMEPFSIQVQFSFKVYGCSYCETKRGIVIFAFTVRLMVPEKDFVFILFSVSFFNLFLTLFIHLLFIIISLD